MSGLRVLHLIPSMGGGGAERQLAYLAEQLARRAADVHVGLLDGGPNLPRLERGGARLHWLDGRSGTRHPRFALEVLRLVRRVRPQVVHTWLPPMDIVGGAAAVACRVPWVLGERASAAWYPRTLRLRARVAVGRFASAVVANSPPGADYWRGVLKRPPPLHVVSNGLPVDEIDAAVPAPADPCGRPVISVVGRLDPQKNLPVLVEGLAAALERCDAVVRVCGDGPDREWLRAELGRRGLERRVLLLGYRGDVWSLLKGAAAFVSVSHCEGHPNAVLEAMACGVPLVVSSIPEHLAFLDEQHALFVPTTDPGALAGAVLDVLARPDAARARACAARRVARECSTAAMAARYEQIYRSLLADAPAGKA